MYKFKATLSVVHLAWSVKDYKFQYTINGTDWLDAKTGTFSRTSGEVEILCINSNSATKWRMFCLNNQDSKTETMVAGLEPYGIEFA